MKSNGDMIGGISRRNWALRLSLVLNVCVFLYVCAHFGSSSGPWVEESPNLGASQVQAESVFGNGAATDHRINGTKIASSPSSSVASDSSSSSTTSAKIKQAKIIPNKASNLEKALSLKDPKKSSGEKNETLKEGNVMKVVEALKDKQNKTVQLIARSPLKLQDAIPCHEKSVEPRKAQRGDYWVLYNYVPMSMYVHCWESITYTTHADYTFLDNLEPLLDRWRAPISIALHAPGTDFPPTLEAIKYARNCGSPLIAQLVTFHIYFSSKHVPKSIPSSDKVMSERYNCSLPPPWVNVSVSKMYKSERKLLYPVNLGRNVARESAPTRYVLASDIELYPSPNLPSKFLEMIRRKDQAVLFKPNPKVFVLSIFEVAEKSQPPVNKTRLMQMLKAGTAIPFHKKLCAGCHNVPRSKEWQEAAETEGLHVFHIGKRIGAFIHWEPIFIGTNDDPFYDERLSWEGKSDKMTQGYALCVLDYDFLILDNAFLVHRPGIKIYKKDAHRDMLTAKTNALIRKIIVPELKVLYGTRKGCAV